MGGGMKQYTDKDGGPCDCATGPWREVREEDHNGNYFLCKIKKGGYALLYSYLRKGWLGSAGFFKNDEIEMIAVIRSEQ